MTYQNGRVVVICGKVGGLYSMAIKIKELGYGENTVIKLDGGGSCILVVNGKEVFGTGENRKINSIGMFE